MVPVSQLVSAVKQYPQVLLNVAGPHDNAAKDALTNCAPVQAAVAEGEKRLNGEGRILLRPSGTEALIRVMVEAGTEAEAKQVAQLVAAAVENAKKQF